MLGVEKRLSDRAVATQGWPIEAVESLARTVCVKVEAYDGPQRGLARWTL